MRTPKLLRSLLALGRAVVIIDWQLVAETADTRADLVVWVRTKVRRRGACGRCRDRSAWEDQGGKERSWRHVDLGYTTSTLRATATRANCATHGPTVAAVPWARHGLHQGLRRPPCL